MTKEQYEALACRSTHPSNSTIPSMDTYPDTDTFAKEVDGGETEGMLQNKTCKRLLSNRVQ